MCVFFELLRRHLWCRMWHHMTKRVLRDEYYVIFFQLVFLGRARFAKMNGNVWCLRVRNNQTKVCFLLSIDVKHHYYCCRTCRMRSIVFAWEQKITWNKNTLVTENGNSSTTQCWYNIDISNVFLGKRTKVKKYV